MSVSSNAVVVTGASTGIGQACALYLDQAGFQVFAAIRRETDAEALQQKASANLTPIFLDVTKPDTIALATKTITRAVGARGLRGLVNNAGIAVGGPLEFLPITELRQQLEINVIGPMAVTQHLLPLLRQGQGRVINISSISGRVTMPFLGPYSASKFALEALTNALRLELHPWQIAVISVQPGSVVTPIWKKSLQKADNLVAGLPLEGERLYGQRLARLRRAVVRTSERGITPEQVAKVVHQGLTANRPKTRYLVGFDAKMGALLVKLLPDRLRDWLILWQS